MKLIIDYLIKKYNPLAIIKYGSYSNGTSSATSDYDALIITNNKTTMHDSSVVDNIQLDVFIYTANEAQDSANIEKMLGVYDGTIVLDTHNLAQGLVQRVANYIDSWQSSYQDDKFGVQWCDKMLTRAKDNNAESLYRWHWVLVDSLEIYMSLCDKYYFGCKKALAYLQNCDKTAYAIYTRALSQFTLDSLFSWINYIRDKFTNKYDKEQ